MARYFIKSVQYGVGDGGMACGPVSGPVVAEAEVTTDEGGNFFFCLVEVMGCPHFFKSEDSLYDINIDGDDDEVEESMEYLIDSWSDYNELFEEKGEDLPSLYRYLIYLVRADGDECEEFEKETTGKWLDEIEIPMSDVEEEYLEDMEDEEDD